MPKILIRILAVMLLPAMLQADFRYPISDLRLDPQSKIENQKSGISFGFQALAAPVVSFRWAHRVMQTAHLRVFHSAAVLCMLITPVSDVSTSFVREKIIPYGRASYYLPFAPPQTGLARSGGVYGRNGTHMAITFDENGHILLHDGGWVAADPKVFPLQSSILIHLKNGRDLMLRVMDVGTNIKHNAIDLSTIGDSPGARKEFYSIFEGALVKPMVDSIKDENRFIISSAKKLPPPKKRVTYYFSPPPRRNSNMESYLAVLLTLFRRKWFRKKSLGWAA